MAVVIIGGVIVSTLLTIFVVPCVYSSLSVFEHKQQGEDTAATPEKGITKKRKRYA